MKIVSPFGGGANLLEEEGVARKADAITQESETKEIIYLLRAILAGIEIIADQDAGSLIEDVEED